MKLHIVAEISGMSGYSKHGYNLCRALINELGEDNVSIEPIGLPVNDVIFAKPLTQDYSKENILMVTRPEVAPMYWTKDCKNFMQYCVFEGTRIPSYWKEILMNNKISKIIVPSVHCKNACQNAMIPEDKIHIVPHGYDPEVFYKESKIDPSSPIRKDKFNFLFAKGWVYPQFDRSGLKYLLQAFTDEFKEGEKVRLILKFNCAYGVRDFGKDLKDLGILQKKDDVVIIPENVPDDVLRGLYSTADCFVMPSMSEGFGLPALEALACGTPIITTNFGGQTGFINNDNGWLVSGKLIPVPGIGHGNDFIYEEAEWLEPSIEELRKALRSAMGISCSAGDKLIGDCGSTVKDWTWTNSAKKLMEVLK